MSRERGTRLRAVGSAVVVLVLLAVAQSAARQQVVPGDPLPGLTPVEFEEFVLGLDDFLEVEDAEEGLGPAYNNTSCAGCHNVPAIGGIAPMTTTRAGIREPDGAYRDVEPGRGSLFQIFSIPTHACQSVIPPEANVIVKRVPVPLFGAGLIEAIPDATLEALADPDDLDRDGVSGRAPIVLDLLTGEPRVGRFGWKSQRATLLDFGADAYRNEMGITNDLFPAELTFRLSARQLALCDETPDPEDVAEPSTGRRGIDNFESFMRLLAPPARGPLSRLVTLGRPGVRGHRLRGVPRACAHDRTEQQSAVRPPAGAAVLGPPAARRRYRRRHPAGRRRARRDPDPATLGAALPTSFAARRQRRDGGRGGPAARQRGDPGAGGLRAALPRRPGGAGSVSPLVVDVPTQSPRPLDA